MIHQEATIKYKSYDPDELGLKSTLRICMICDNCGRVRWGKKQDYHDLCKSCEQKNKIISKETKQKIGDANRGRGGTKLICNQCYKEYKVSPYRKDNSKFCSKKCQAKWISINKSGKNSSCYNRQQSEEEIQKRSGKNHPHYGKFGEDHPSWRGGFNCNRSYVLLEVQCIKLNKRFNNSEFHHITKSIGIFIPYKFHHHIHHNIKTGLNMGLINMLSLQFINGGL